SAVGRSGSGDGWGDGRKPWVALLRPGSAHGGVTKAYCAGEQHKVNRLLVNHFTNSRSGADRSSARRFPTMISANDSIGRVGPSCPRTEPGPRRVAHLRGTEQMLESADFAVGIGSPTKSR